MINVCIKFEEPTLNMCLVIIQTSLFCCGNDSQLVVSGFNATLTAKVKSWALEVGDAYLFPGFPTPVLTQMSFQSHPLLFLHALGVRAEIPWKESLPQLGIKQPPGHESDTLITKPHGRRARRHRSTDQLSDIMQSNIRLFFGEKHNQ